jgi:hypothetical protein
LLTRAEYNPSGVLVNSRGRSPSSKAPDGDTSYHWAHGAAKDVSAVFSLTNGSVIPDPDIAVGSAGSSGSRRPSGADNIARTPADLPPTRWGPAYRLPLILSAARPYSDFGSIW